MAPKDKDPPEGTLSTPSPVIIDTITAGTGGPVGPNAPRKTTGTASPQRVEQDYRRAKITFVQVSTEELGTLALMGGAASVALSGTIYFWKLAPSETSAVGLVICIAVTLVCYLIFAGLFRRIRKRSDLSPWHLFGP